ncbi:MAG: molybdenum cofactor guanylyltransferase [Sphingomonadales bacterium]|nr:molybdenum cofactor guanylyltransferase [Sphingomonadales bacterium]
MAHGDDRIVLGAVLAGGGSRRFGSDKALALLHGKPLVVHAAEALARHALEVVLCGRRMESFSSLADRPTPDMGPLGGLNAALHHAAGQGFAGVLCTGCDMPVFPDALAQALIGKGPAIVENQYLMGYWPAALAPALDTHLAGETDRSVRAWLAVARPRIVPAPELPNINTQKDLRRLEERGTPGV